MSDLLHTIQQQVVAKKSKYNSFGKYNYRSCEDIVDAVKKLLPVGASLILSDELVVIGDRYYIKATASLHHESKVAQAIGYAREALEQKGMNEGQITGSASSYARKYALCGLFAIDDGIDDDSEKGKTAPPKVSKAPKEEITSELKTHNWFIAKLATIINDKQFADFSNGQANKDARDKLYLDAPELSKKVEDAIQEKKDWLHKQSMLQA